jgi:hypothetical protein
MSLNTTFKMVTKLVFLLYVYAYGIDWTLKVVNIILDGYSTDTLEFRWNPQPVSRDTRLALAQFDLGEMKRSQCDKEYITGVYYNMNMICTYKLYFIDIYFCY